MKPWTRFMGAVFFMGVRGILFASEAPPVVEGLVFDGVRGVPRAELRALMVTRSSVWYDFLPFVDSRRFDAKVFREDLRRLLAYYREQGYFEVAIDTIVVRSDPGSVLIRFAVREGEPLRLSEVLIEGLPEPEPPDSLRLMEDFEMRPGVIWTRSGLETDRVLIGRHLQDRGFAFVRVDTLFRLGEDDHRAALTFRVNPGVVCQIGSIRIEGNQKVPNGVVRRGLTFREGLLYSREELLESQRQLFRSGIFRSVVVGVPDSTARFSPVDVLVAVSERPSRRIRVGGGFDTEEKLRASLGWTHRNFLGGARQFQVSGAVSSLNRIAQAGLRQPYFGGSRNWLNLGAFAKRDTLGQYEQVEVGASVAFERNLSVWTDLTVQARSGVVDFDADSLFTEFQMSLQRDTRDDFFDPSRGSLMNLTVRERGLLFQSDREFLKVIAEARWYRRLPLASVLAFRAKGGLILGLGRGVEVPPIERFFGGGMNSVRGWSLERLGPKDVSNRPLGGESQVESSLEIRTRWFKYVGTVVFLDAGMVGPDLDAFVPDDLGWAVGGGIRYLSPIGPVRFDVGYRITGDDREGRRRRFHLSLGQAF